MDAEARNVLDFWFGAVPLTPVAAAGRGSLWFGADPATDQRIAAQFSGLMLRATNGDLDHWKSAPTGRLALIILCDQFPRNVFRGMPAAFAGDMTALNLCRDGAALATTLSLPEHSFFLMPFQHAEDLAIQQEGIRRYQQLRDNVPREWQPCADSFLNFAIQHRDIVARFGRFPHRNEILQRDTTPEEAEWLAAGGESFGQSARN